MPDENPGHETIAVGFMVALLGKVDTVIARLQAVAIPPL